MQYWLIINGVRLGPMDLERVLSQPGLNFDTPVWCQGMSDWAKAGDVPEIRDRMYMTPPAMPGSVGRDSTANQVQDTPQPQPIPQIDNRPMPESFLGWNIAAALLCCVVTGVVGIIYSAQVSSAYYAGDYAKARRMSANAKGWMIASIIAGVVLYPAYFLCMLL